MSITRRHFLKQAAVAGGLFPLFTIAGTKSSGRVLGANDVIRVGIAGIHGQGNAHIDQYLGFKNVQVTHLIDPDRSLFESRSQKIREKGGNTPKCFRTSGERWRQGVDVSHRGADRWHSLMTIWACQAGGDVRRESAQSQHRRRTPSRQAAETRPHLQHGTKSRSNEWRAKGVPRSSREIRPTARFEGILAAALDIGRKLEPPSGSRV
jgi:hypothetical protein